MALEHRTRMQLQTEGITTPDDLTDFDEEIIKQVVENLRKPGGQVPNPLYVANTNGQFPRDIPQMIPTPPYKLSAISLARLKGAIELAKYHEVCERELSAANMQWKTVGVEFMRHWKILLEKKDKDPGEVPKINARSLPILKWVEAINNFLAGTVGVRGIPLSYVSRPDAAVPEAPPLRGVGRDAKPYSEQHGSVEAELVARALHTHANFQEDSSTVFGFVEEGVRGSSYAASIQPFARRRDGRGALKAIKDQYAGKDKWEKEMKKQEEIIHNRKWKGTGSYTLDLFVSAHRNAYVVLTQCSEHVTVQLPNGTTRVRYLLDNIECGDAELLASIANVRKDTVMVSDFESAVAYILPSDPVAKRLITSKGKRMHADISSVDGSGIKSGIGPKTGVELRYHTTDEYENLSVGERAELSEWRAAERAKGVVFNKTDDKKKVKFALGTKGGKGTKPTSKPKKDSKALKKTIKKMISSALANERASISSAQAEEEKKQEEIEQGKYLLSLVKAEAAKQSKKGGPSVGAAEAKEPAIALNKILGRAKGNKSKSKSE